jgi:hypothetical protein
MKMLNLKIAKASAATRSASMLGHTYDLMITSVPLFQWGSGRRDPPELLLLQFSKCWW